MCPQPPDVVTPLRWWHFSAPAKVEQQRLQGTILHEHWRIQFRRQYFTNRLAMQRTLDAFMTFYNEQRRHQGYRLRGGVPADLFWGTVAARSHHDSLWGCQHLCEPGHPSPR